MNYLSVENLSKTYVDKVLFENIGFGLSKGDKTALIADNGTGKTTLLKIIAGKDFKDEGKVILRTGIRVGYLSQSPKFNSHLTIIEFINNTKTLTAGIIRNYNIALQLQAKNDTPENRRKVLDAINLMDKTNAWDFDRKIKEMLYRFDINNLQQPVNTLSGGQKKRLAISLLLLDNPDILLLDEPTNHLDIEMIEWLEKYLSAPGLTLLTVTHDRYFLDKVCNNIIELNRGKLFSYKGNYAYFLEKRAERVEKRAMEIEKANKLMKKELEWLRRMPKARTHKSKARIDNYYNIKEKASELTLEKELSFEMDMKRLGGKILEAVNVSKNYGSIKILENFNYLFKKGERVGIIGKNGVGKSTFLNILVGFENPDSGEIIRGDTLIAGYYTQAGLKTNPEKRIIDVVTDIAEIIVINKNKQMTASQFLNYFMFPPEMQIQPVAQLSGGERRRLYLLTVLIKNPNFLILDEPTNDLDIITLNKLEEFLSDFKGCLILVSHDRYFLDRLTDHLLIFEGDGKIKDFYGNYTQYKLWKDNQLKSKKTATEKIKDIHKEVNRKKEKKRKGLSFNEKREYEHLEREIEHLEKEKIEIEKQLNNGLLDYKKLEETSIALGIIIEQIDNKMLRLIELDEKG